MSQQELSPPARVPAPDASNSKPPASRPGPVGRWLGAGLRALGQARRRLFCAVANGWRRLRRKQIPHYVVITLDHAVSERAPIVPWWYAYVPWVQLPLSLEYLHTALSRIAGDPDVRGVVFLVKSPMLSLAKAQSMAQMVARFRQWDAGFCGTSDPARPYKPKEVVVHLEDGGVAALVFAAAADRVVMTPLANWSFTGLRAAPLYLKETLARIGLTFEVARIAPWKSAFENWERSHMSPESRDQTTWLLDSLFEDIVQAIAQGRNLSPDTVRALIDRAPLIAPDAQAAGLVDALLYEDELPGYLGALRAEPGATAGTAPARLARYARIRGLLLHRPRRPHAQAVGVLTLEGSIVPGASRQFPVPLPLVGDRLIGSTSAAAQIREARQNRRLAALILHVDSGGGSALASDLIWRELALLAQEKPLVVYFGDVAASGGYYIATPGRKIVAQSATLTGSIGVVIAKLVTGGAADKLGANREIIQRGANADLQADDAPWDAAQRAKIQEGVGHSYAQFKDRVSRGRKLPLDDLDRIAQGRVWTGKQAQDHDLVDALGDFSTALELACAEAGLPQDGSVTTLNLGPARERPLAEPAALALYPGTAGGESLAELVGAALTGEWAGILGRDGYWYWADGLPRIRE